MVFLQLATAFGEADVAPVGGAIGRAGKTGLVGRRFPVERVGSHNGRTNRRQDGDTPGPVRGRPDWGSAPKAAALPSDNGSDAQGECELTPDSMGEVDARAASMGFVQRLKDSEPALCRCAGISRRDCKHGHVSHGDRPDLRSRRGISRPFYFYRSTRIIRRSTRGFASLLICSLWS
jgi:hypothetical protein